MAKHYRLDDVESEGTTPEGQTPPNGKQTARARRISPRTAGLIAVFTAVPGVIFGASANAAETTEYPTASVVASCEGVQVDVSSGSGSIGYGLGGGVLRFVSYTDGYSNFFASSDPSTPTSYSIIALGKPYTGSTDENGGPCAKGSEPTPDPTTASPTPDPTTASPTPDPTTASPTPDPTTASPTPDPTTASPTPDPTTASPTPDPTPASPTPSPTDLCTNIDGVQRTDADIAALPGKLHRLENGTCVPNEPDTAPNPNPAPAPPPAPNPGSGSSDNGSSNGGGNSDSGSSGRSVSSGNDSGSVQVADCPSDQVQVAPVANVSQQEEFYFSGVGGGG